MAAIPSHAAIPRTASASVSTANSARDGSGTTVSVFTAPASGSLLHKAYIKATGTTTAGFVMLYVNDGGAPYALTEVVVDAITPGAGVASFQAVVDLLDPVTLTAFHLQGGHSIEASTQRGERFDVTIHGADL